jgi:hypothetical protein
MVGDPAGCEGRSRRSARGIPSPRWSAPAGESGRTYLLEAPTGRGGRGYRRGRRPVGAALGGWPARHPLPDHGSSGG